MTVVYSEAEQTHAPEYEFEGNGFTLRKHPESRGRAEHILQALRRNRRVQTARPEPASPGDLTGVHAADYVSFLREVSEIDRTLAPDTFIIRGKGRAPRNPIAALGYYGTDPATPIVAGTWDRALAAASVALSAADRVASGEKACYALCRPPGHHAGTDYFGGFCYLNNAALAADRLLSRGTVAIFDFDYHHGNGTQDIFYSSNRAFFASIHVDPEIAYPHFYGYRDELGQGPGYGWNRNYPLSKTCTANEYRTAVLDAMYRIANIDPEYLVVSVGFDAYEKDPVGGLCLSSADFAWIGSTLAELDKPTVLVQEGGYAIDALGECATAFLGGFEG
jgi:acetoin utilization deacetylase AcuC-like enzyme